MKGCIQASLSWAMASCWLLRNEWDGRWSDRWMRYRGKDVWVINERMVVRWVDGRVIERRIEEWIIIV